MVAVWVIVLVLLGHWVADFVWQPHWMSMRKSKEWWVLAQHAARITVGGGVVGLLICLLSSHVPYYWGHHIWYWAALNGAAHFAIDAVTSRQTSRLWREEKVHNFFVVIGFDQFLHVAFAVVTLAWLVL